MKTIGSSFEIICKVKDFVKHNCPEKVIGMLASDSQLIVRADCSF